MGEIVHLLKPYLSREEAMETPQFSREGVKEEDASIAEARGDQNGWMKVPLSTVLLL